MSPASKGGARVPGPLAAPSSQALPMGALPPNPRAKGFQPDACPAVREVLSRVGDKWSVLIVSVLGGGRRRFSELRRSIEGISQRMLTLTLKGLERDGLVTRTVFPTVPPRVEYDLTPLGATLLQPIEALAAWAHENKTSIHEAQRRFDQRAARRAKASQDGAASGPRLRIPAETS
jgi:DNA-binding HxlR family transcriptional regulator